MTDSASTSPKRPFVTQIDTALASRLQKDLTDQGFSLAQPQYTLFQATKKGVSCTLYASGKLVVQGKEMAEFLEFYLEPEILGQFSFTYASLDLDLTPHMGVDESGKGDLFGPLCVAGVFADGEGITWMHQRGVRDSKSLNDVTILKLADEIRKKCAHYVLILRPLKYNELYGSFKNLNKLLGWGHATVIENLVSSTKCEYAIIDQFASEHVVEGALARKGINIKLTQRTKGESDTVVAAASILARAAFLYGLEAMKEEWGQVFPKGASPAVVKAGRQFVARYGAEALPNIAKMHFKTIQELVITGES